MDKKGLEGLEKKLGTQVATIPAKEIGRLHEFIGNNKWRLRGVTVAHRLKHSRFEPSYAQLSVHRELTERPVIRRGENLTVHLGEGGKHINSIGGLDFVQFETKAQRPIWGQSNEYIIFIDDTADPDNF